MRGLLVMLTGGCYAATPPAGAPCDPAAPRCPSGQVCVAKTCQPDGTMFAIDAPIAGDATEVQRPCPADPDLLVCLAFDTVPFASPLANEGALPLAAVFADVSRTPVGTGGAAVFGATSTMQFPAASTLAGVVAIEATVRLDAAIAPMERVGIVDADTTAGGFSLFVFAGTATAHRVRCNLGAGDVFGDTALTLGAWTTLACTCEGGATVLRHDGVVLASTAGCPGGSAATTGVQIGQNSRAVMMLPPNEPFIGAIDRVRFWKRVPQ